MLKGVTSRGGWGTIWDCLANNKPAALAYTSFAEDPEMGHTQKTMSELGLAVIIDGSAGSFLTGAAREKIILGMDNERAKDFKNYGNYASDGYGYIASKIHQTDDL